MTKEKQSNREPVNVLIAAEYRAPRSGNFIASLLDLAESIRKQGGQVVFLFPAQEEDRPWAAWLDGIDRDGFGRLDARVAQG